MNRLEILLEALKEADRHIEAMIPRHCDTTPTMTEARARAGEIEKAIMAEKGYQGENVQCAPPLNPDMVASLQNKVGDLTAIQANLERIVRELTDENTELLKRLAPNPALENVLAKLRDRVAKGLNETDATIISSYCDPVLTLGDLRRWVESEVKHD